MIEVRFHGRGGQGAVTSAELTALAVITAGKFAQSMPSFGPERRGAPVKAFLRISDEKIRVRAEVTKPDVVVILDDSLFSVVDCLSGLKKDGWLIVNSTKTAETIRNEAKYTGKLALIDALKIAMEVLKVPITNTTMIGAFLRATDIVSLDLLKDQVKERFNPKLAERNNQALDRAYKETNIS